VPALNHQPVRQGVGEVGSAILLKELGPEKFSQWILDQKRLLITDTTMRDAHQSLIATRMRTRDMLHIASAYSNRTPGLFSLEMWGGATFDTAMRFLNECPWERLRSLREKVPNILFQMLFRGSNAVGYSNYPDNVVAGFIGHAADSGMDIFRIFDSLNYLPNMQVAMEAVREHGKSICEAAICYSGDILNPARSKYDLNYYIAKAKELEKMGAHILCIKDMAGLCKPQAAYNLVHALKQEIGIPIHFHTHDTSGLNAASVIAASRAGVDIADLAIASMSGSTSQPNLNSVCAALASSEQDPGLDLDALNEISDYWEHVLSFYKPFDSAPRAGTAEVYEHEMPGGQYTNLREKANAMGLGHRWREIARTYAEVNQLFGDIIKVTPSSKVVGDMCMFLVTRGIKASDVTKIKPGSIDFPESVIDMLSGGLGQPDGGWPADVQKVVLGPNHKITTKRPGELAEPVDFNEVAKLLQLPSSIDNPQSADAIYSHLMYPGVYKDFQSSRARYDDLSKLPTPAFFYGLQIGEEIEVEIDPGKILIIKLISIGEADNEGRRTLFYELNGMPRESVVVDKSLVSTTAATRQKGDPADPNQICAPLPGMITEIAVSPGTEVKAGDKLITLEAMKMLTTVSAQADGIIKDILVKKGIQVDTDDLLVCMETSG
jgi:pyruvate carboxylase